MFYYIATMPTTTVLGAHLRGKGVLDWIHQHGLELEVINRADVIRISLLDEPLRSGEHEMRE